ncbi:MAG: hypothetical protein HYW78_04555 [Parcubacteria group bacterium]|nr:hypothetical protein [Parcubacteria group bacterium]
MDRKQQKYIYIIVGALVVIGLGILLLSDQGDEIVYPQGDGAQKSTEKKTVEEPFDITKVKVLNQFDKSDDPSVAIPVHAQFWPKTDTDPMDKELRKFEATLNNEKLGANKFITYQGDVLIITFKAEDKDYELSLDKLSFRESVAKGQSGKIAISLDWGITGVSSLMCTNCNGGKGKEIAKLYIVPRIK